MNSAFRSLNLKLSRFHDVSYSCLVGNATTGLSLSLKALGLHDKLIALPNSICPHVALAILHSGNYPFFIDIDKHNLCLSPKKLLEVVDKVSAVIAVHAYGSICDINSIITICRDNNIPLIEDLAVAQGATVDLRPVGTFGDLSVVSFGSGKIIDVGHGGAVFTSSRYLYKNLIKLIQMLKPISPTSNKIITSFGDYHTFLYNNYHYKNEISSHADFFVKRALVAANNMYSSFNSTYLRVIDYKFSKIDKLIDERIANFDKLYLAISPYQSHELSIFRPSSGSVNWRFNMFINNRDKIFKSLLTLKYPVSSWFPSADIYFNSRKDDIDNCYISDQVGNSILNLWVNEKADDDYIMNVSSHLLSHLQTS